MNWLGKEHLMARIRDGPDLRTKGSALGVNMPGLIIIGLNLVLGSVLQADSPDASGYKDAQQGAHLNKHEKKLERMQADRSIDNEHTRQSEEEFRKGTVTLSNDDVQHLRDIQDLRAVEGQVSAGQNQKTLTHQSYIEAVRKFGSGDPKSGAAREIWKQSQQAMDPLLLSRQQLKQDVHEGGRLVRNDKVILQFEKRNMNSDDRYRAIDDRKIRKEEKAIAADQKATPQNIQPSVYASEK
jgi:hypothetical protein